jgi:hypothetical protein
MVRTNAKTKAFRKAGAVVFCLLFFALSGCSKDPVVIGDSQAHQYQETTYSAIELHYFDMMDSAVTVQMRFSTRLPGLFDNQDAMLTVSDFGQLIILSPQGKYSAAILNLSKGDPIVVNGTLTSVTPPGRSKMFLAIQAG